MGRLAALFIFLIVLALAPAAGAQAPGAKALQARLYAPCCYGGTLDIHDSDLARTLREEIESRLAHGETSDQVQADFVARYGTRVVAAPNDVAFRAIGAGAAVLGVLAAVALAVVMRRWTRRSTSREPQRESPSAPDALDARIDAELAEIDG